MSDYQPQPIFNLPGAGLLEISGANAQAWRTGIARAQSGSGPCNLVFIGDSVTARYLASVAIRGFAPRTAALLASELSLTDAPGYYPLSTNCNYTATMTYAVAPGSLSLTEDSGLCGEAAYIPPATTATSVAVNPSTGLWIHCQKGPGIGGQFTYTVNGGAVQGPVNAGAAPRGSRIWDHGAAGGLVVGSNTVVITPDATFGSVVEGITFFNTNHNTTRPQGFITPANSQTGTGLRVWVAGHSGFTTAKYAIPGFNDIAGASKFTDAFSVYQPHAVVIALGINDINTSVSTDGYIANLKTMISYIAADALANGYRMPTLVFLAMYGTTLDTTGQYLRYASVLKAFCKAFNYAFLDVSSLMGSVVGNTVLSSDAIHPNDAGHYLMANYLSKFLLDA